ncbi:MAG: capsule assembly Wzi family protein, partial [Calditrichota bacterium]
QKYYPENGVSGALDLSDKGKYLNEVLVNRYRATGAVHLVYPHITLGNRTSINQEYKYDPKYAGDLSESEHWLYGRVNDAYINVNFSGFNLFVGRMARNWGPVGHYSLLLSDEPYTYDHFLFSWEHDWIKLSVIFARLEDLSAYGLDNIQKPDSLTYYPDARKFLAGHRLDLRLLDNLQLAFTEMATYGGPNRDFDLSFINPMTFYYGLQRNDKKLNNGKWAVDLFYKPLNRLTLYGQFLIDDVIVNNDPGQNDRARYPDRLAVYGSLRTGDLLLKGLNTDLGYTRVWNETYLSRWTWENYHYRELGLGYPCGSCEEISLKLGYWGFFPLFLQNELIYGRYGAVSLTDVVALHKEPFPVRPVTYNLVDHFRINYHFKTCLNFFLDFLYVREPNHYLNRLNQGSDLTISLGFNLFLTTSYIKK